MAAASSQFVEQLSIMDSDIALIKLSPSVELERGNVQASRISARIASAIPDDASEIVQLACAIEAIEREDHQSWPSQWLVGGLLPSMLQTLTTKCAGDDLTKFQRARYQELRDSPEILQQITQGFTPKLSLSDRHGFVQALIDAGFRRTKRGDEASAINDHGVLHVALSYKHAHDDHKLGKISPQTAEEAYDIISNLPLIKTVPYVRVWIDQNLSRYPGHGPWYERGFIPYATLIVISALRESGGFSIGRKSPWIWVETSIALRGRGVHCMREICPSIRDLIVYPDDALLDWENFETIGQITAETHSVLSCVRNVLIAVSWWTPKILDHADYLYVEEFMKFCLWARMQVIRMKHHEKLSLNSVKCEDTMLEKLAWVKSLPYVQSSRQVHRPPYLRIEGDIDTYREILKLLSLSGKNVQRGDVTEVIGAESGFEVFCFSKKADKVFLDVIPSKQADDIRRGDSESPSVQKNDIERLKEWRNGFSLWDRRIDNGGPKFELCNSIFGRGFGMRNRLGELEATIILGGVQFSSVGFQGCGMRLERVYEAQHESSRRLCESDVLCIRELSESMERKFIEEFMSENIFNVVSRLVKAQTGQRLKGIHPYAIGISAETVADTTARIKERQREESLQDEFGCDVVCVKRSRIGEQLYTLSVTHNKLGQVIHTFETSAIEEEMDFNLLYFKTTTDVNNTLAKIRLMMGSKEFDGYSPVGLSLGLFDENRDADGKRYPDEFKLDGSEFRVCTECLCTFSPVNTWCCVLSTWRESRKINVVWTDLHLCSGDDEECNIIGLTC